MSLSQDPACSLLKAQFVCGWRNIEHESYCGVSSNHDLTNPAVKTTNGAGPHNIQLFMLAADGTVLHCLPGYWDPNDLACELKLAQDLNQVWLDQSLTRAQKDVKFKAMQLAHFREHSHQMSARSQMQSFDKKFEEKRRPETSDCIIHADAPKPAPAPRGAEEKGRKAERLEKRSQEEKVRFKTTDEIVHERMAERPFVAYEKFDVAAFSDYGRPKYDKKAGAGEGKLGTAGKKK